MFVLGDYRAFSDIGTMTLCALPISLALPGAKLGFDYTCSLSFLLKVKDCRMLVVGKVLRATEAEVGCCDFLRPTDGLFSYALSSACKSFCPFLKPSSWFC